MKNNWYVITGGPCSGKTTTIGILKKAGHKTTRETARDYIDTQLKKGLTLEKVISNPQKLQDEITQIQLFLELSLNPTEQIFLDRAFPDTIGYYNYYKLNIPSFAQKDYRKSFYRKVFYLESIPMKNDEIRFESDEEATQIAKYVYDSYAGLGLEIVNVPVMDKQKRVDFILSRILENKLSTLQDQ